ncbi:hypothetical protein EYV94_01580 [Puteibacter caeruleilacunae]|nr:hypothetical protein EYV94_01580 [Puteibacter caeruleilacunae]
MKRSLISLSLAVIMLFATGCASIVSKSSYPISINSTPSEAKITITDKKGIEVYKGNTPATMKLKASNGFFSRARYQVRFEKDGYDTRTVPIEYKLDGWYFGNILFGGVIGLLIVDPATGAMYKLDTEFLHEHLTSSSASASKDELKVYSLADVPTEWRDHLQVISEE